MPSAPRLIWFLLFEFHGLPYSRALFSVWAGARCKPQGVWELFLVPLKSPSNQNSLQCLQWLFKILPCFTLHFFFFCIISSPPSSRLNCVLPFQKGDIIYIIEKPPVGTWTGKLNNKVGSFKFIYVNILPEDSPPQRRKSRNSKKQRGKSRPNTLEEVLDSIGLDVRSHPADVLLLLPPAVWPDGLLVCLQELSPLLSMHGFQSLEDFAGLKESHLNELNITDPDQRYKILNASELLRDCRCYRSTGLRYYREVDPFTVKFSQSWDLHDHFQSVNDNDCNCWFLVLKRSKRSIFSIED